MGVIEYLESQTFLGVPLLTYLYLAIVLVVAVALERVMTRYLRRFAKRAKLQPHLTNNVVLTFRLLILIGAVAFLIRVGGLPTDWLLYFSAISGTALGFASTKTIGNFIAGLYLFAARPFKVGDYVRIGTVEGIVEEITINYTKVWTIGNNMVSVANIQIMDRDVTNFLYEGDGGGQSYCYTFEMGFDHSVSTPQIETVFGQVFEKYKTDLPHEPAFMLTRSDAFSRVYTVYLYVRRPGQILSLRPKIAEEVFRLWDKERTERKP